MPRLGKMWEKFIQSQGWVKREKAKREGVPLSTSLGQKEYPNAKSADMLSSYVGWVFSCVKARARDVSRIELKLYRVINRATGEVEEVMEHDILSLLRTVNPFLTFRKLIEHTQAYKDLTGEAFWWLNRAGQDGRGMITQIWLLRPDYMNVKTTEDGFISGYEYKVPGKQPIQFGVDEVIHHKEFNPANPYRGMGVVRAAAVTIDAEGYAEEYNKKFFRNSAVPEIVLSTEKNLTDHQIKRMHAEWSNKYGGTQNAHRTAILEGGLDVKPFSISQKDMEFLAGMGFSRDKILGLFEVPKSRLGMTEGVTVSNAEATIGIYLKYLIKPLMEGIRDDLNEFMLPLFKGTEDMFFEITDPVPQDVNAEMLRLQAEFAMGAVTPNEVREEGGRDQVVGLDSFYLPFSVTPVAGEAKEALDAERAAMAEEASSGPVAPITGEDGKRITASPQKRKKRIVVPPMRLREKVAKDVSARVTQEVIKTVAASIGKVMPHFVEKAKDAPESIGPSGWSAQAKSVFWKSLVAKTDHFEKSYKDKVLGIFNDQERKVLNALTDAEKKSVEKIAQSDIESILISVTQENKISADLLLPLVREILEEVGNDTLDFLDPDLVGFDAQAESVRQFLRADALKGIRVMNKVTKSKLRKVLSESIQEGLGPVAAGRKVREVFNEAKTVRALRIARTETLKAANRGTLEAYKQSGVVVGKEWLTAEDEVTCQWCEPMGGKVYAIDDEFFNHGETYLGKEGGVLNINLEDIVAPPLHPNCRCTIVPVTISQRAQNQAINKGKAQGA